jgi:predicted phage-related endonuclease
LLLYHVLRDEETIAEMREQAVAFWHEHVLARVPPPPRTMHDLKLLWPRPVRNAIEASPEIATIIREHQDLAAEMNSLGARKDECEFQIGEFARDYESITMNGKALLSYKAQARETVDGKALKAALPEVYDKYLRRTEYRVLRHSTRGR